MVFDDVLEHEVINKSDDIRVILMVDLLRPMNKFYNALNYFSTVWLNRRWSEHFISTANNTTPRESL